MGILRLAVRVHSTFGLGGNMTLVRFGVLLGSAVTALLAGAPQPRAETLADTVKSAVAMNPRIKSSVHNRRSIDSEVRRARSLYLPQIDLRAGAGPEYSENADTINNNRRHIRQELSAILAQRLYDGGEADAEVDRQLGRSESAADRVRETSEFTALDAIEAHLDVVRLRRILALAEDNVNVHRRLTDRVRQRSGGGAGRAADLSQVLSRLEQATSSLEETRGLLREAEASYKAVVGTVPPTLEDGQIPVAALPVDFDASLKIAQEKNPTVNIRAADIKAARAEVDAANSRYMPKINFEVSGNHDRNVNGFQGRDNEARALIVLRWNLYAGGGDVANKAAAVGRLGQATSVRDEALWTTERELSRAWASYQTAQTRAAVLTSSVRHNVEVRDAYDQQFQISQRSLLDLLDSENELFTSQTRLITDQETAVFASYRILAVDGLLLSTLGVEPPAEADATRMAPKPVMEK
jgi:adhesin transport system outer membrane protein